MEMTSPTPLYSLSPLIHHDYDQIGRSAAMRQSSRGLCHHRRHIRLDNLRTLILADNLLRLVVMWKKLHADKLI